eukprot:CAMPEP_0178440420 /NCGR_PEP_ID=MMETSP0689_2-20121128/36779_1 /TAXON_ID=160604 /ORGANISM="Amphidinium massartii, Strain CS-259" /LENGTH=66 /DNA_ID=CAMNT_0020063213 /DNA_START=373 /DNA_END=573 /DNA_ORIENTATION=-
MTAIKACCETAAKSGAAASFFAIHAQTVFRKAVLPNAKEMSPPTQTPPPTTIIATGTPKPGPSRSV